MWKKYDNGALCKRASQKLRTYEDDVNKYPLEYIIQYDRN